MGRDYARDQAMEAMLLAMQREPSLVPADGGVLFLHARPHPAFSEMFGERLVCHQDFKSQAVALENAGWKTVDEPEGKFQLVLLLPDRQRDQTLADYALAFDHLEDGGVLMVGMHNDWGARRYEKTLGGFAGNVTVLSKFHCRAFWTVKKEAPDAATHAAWRAHGLLRKEMDGRFWTRPGLFSWDHVDNGSLLLTQHLPKRIEGRVADLGAGWGFLSDFILRNHPDILSLDCFEADRVAIECMRRNLGLIPVKLKPKLHWADVTQGVGEERCDFVVMNPPFHEGRTPDHHIGTKFIAAAARMLKPGGQLWLVANRNLPYEHYMEEAFAQSKIVMQTDGYKILTGVKAAQTHH